MTPRLRARALPTWIVAAALAVAGSSIAATGAGAARKITPAPQLGFNSYVQDLCQSNATWASDAQGQFTELKALGANSIALAFPIYMASINSSSLFVRRTCGTGYQTPSAARLAVAIREAHALHLRVFLRPLLNESMLQSKGAWRGVIHPKNVGQWFKSYLSVMTPYLKLAQQQKVEYFAISTELDSMSKKSNWTSLISAAKKIYKGSLTFTVSWSFGATGKVTHAGTTPGMDTYQAVSLPNNATPAELLSGWNNAVASSNKVPFALSSATIDEVAILAQDGAYAQPYAWSLPPVTYPFDQNIQASWYSMACSFFKMHSMRGIYFWGVWYADGANALPSTPSPDLAQKIQPASAAVIKSCYTGA
jgi:Glycoside Hydrolase Family 113